MLGNEASFKICKGENGKRWCTLVAYNFKFKFTIIMKHFASEDKQIKIIKGSAPEQIKEQQYQHILSQKQNIDNQRTRLFNDYGYE